MPLQTLLGTRLPIIQAPMAGVQDSRLALAVCRAGALGSIPAAMLLGIRSGTELKAKPNSNQFDPIATILGMIGFP